MNIFDVKILLKDRIRLAKQGLNNGAIVIPLEYAESLVEFIEAREVQDNER